MFQVFEGFVTSKKFVAMVAGLIASYAARYGLHLPDSEVAAVVALFISYIFAQGQADKGKEAAKIEAGIREEGTQP